jgi:hypothetical protein
LDSDGVQDVDVSEYIQEGEWAAAAVLLSPGLILGTVSLFALLVSALVALYGCHARDYHLSSHATVHAGSAAERTCSESVCALLNNLGHLLASLLLGLLNLLLLLLSVAGFYAYFSIAKMLTLYGGGAPHQCVVAEQVLIGADQVSSFAGRMYDEPAVTQSITLFKEHHDLLEMSNEELSHDTRVSTALDLILDDPSVDILSHCPAVDKYAPTITPFLSSCETAPFVFETLAWVVGTLFDSGDPDMVCPSGSFVEDGQAMHETLDQIAAALQTIDDPCGVAHRLLDASLALCVAVEAEAEAVALNTTDSLEEAGWQRAAAKASLLDIAKESGEMAVEIKEIFVAAYPQLAGKLEKADSKVQQIDIVLVLNLTSSLSFEPLAPAVCEALWALQWAQLAWLLGSSAFLLASLFLVIYQRKYGLLLTLADLREQLLRQLDVDGDGQVTDAELAEFASGGRGFLKTVGRAIPTPELLSRLPKMELAKLPPLPKLGGKKEMV